MLSEQVIEQLVEVLVRRIEKVNTYTLKKIAEAIKEIGDVPPSRAYDLAMILKYGGDYDKIVKEIAKITELNEKEIEEIFKKVAKKNLSFAKQFYDYRNIKYIPYEKNLELQAQVKAIAKITQDTYRNLSNTLAFTRKKNGKVITTSLAQTYQDVIDEAVTSIIQGKDSFNSAMNRAIKDLSFSGLKTIDWESGYSRRLDSSVYMNLRGAIRDFSMTLNQQFGEEYGADGVEISVHDKPAPDHAEVQGKQFSIIRPDGTRSITRHFEGEEVDENNMSEFEKFQSDKDAYSYDKTFFPAISKETKHDRRSIGEYNCYHYTLNVVLGISKPQYTQEQLDKINEENKKGFTLDRKHYTLYEGTQLQRKMELAIRRLKDRQTMAKESGLEDLATQTDIRITELINKYIELSKKSGLPTKMERLRLR